ncbi:hypothetical protein [Amnibacterium kyonggiense]
MRADSPITRRTDRAEASKPLRRRPKQLDEAPKAFDASGGGRGGAPLPGRPGTGDGRKRPTGAGAGVTDEEGSIAAPDDAARIDPVVRARAREIAARLSVPKPKADRRASRGGGGFTSVPYTGSSDDIDLDATLQVLAERPVPEDEDVVVRERVRAPRSVVLLVDVSGSMKGSASAPPPRPWARSPRSSSRTGSPSSRSGRTRRCCRTSAIRSGRSSCSTGCSGSRREG